MRALLALAAVIAAAALYLLLAGGDSVAPAPSVTKEPAAASRSDQDGPAELTAPADTDVRDEVETSATAAAEVAEEPTTESAAEAARPTARVVVKWLGPDGVGGEAFAIRGTDAFVNGPRVSDERTTAALRRGDLGVAVAELPPVALGAWTIGATSATGATRLQTAVLREPDTTHEVEFALGGSTVQGTVWGATGQPLPGATITIQCPEPSARTASVRTTTAADGRYEVTGLHPGAGWFSADAETDEGPLELADHQLVIPGSGALVVDVGSPLGTARARIRVVDIAGEPLWSGSIEAIQSDGTRTVHGKLDAEGQVELDLTPGDWILQLWSMDGNQGSIGELDVVAAGEIERQFALRGARIVGAVEWPDGDAPSGPGDGQVVSLMRGDPDDPYRVKRCVVDEQGRFRFDGVEPGEYWLRTGPREAAEPVTISVGSAVSSIDSTLRLVAGD